MEHPLNYAMGALTLLLIAGGLLTWSGILRALVARRPLVAYEPRALVPWTGFDLSILGLSALVIQAIGVRLVADNGDGEFDVTSPHVMAAVIVSRIAWFAVALVYLARKVGVYADDIGFDLRRLPYDLRLAGTTFLAAILPVYGLQYFVTQVLGYKSEHPLVELTREQPSVGALSLMTLAAVVVAPLVEEFLLRVLVQGWLEKKQLEHRLRSDLMAPDEPAGFGPIIVSAAIFAALHGWPDQIALFVLSLFLGYLYQRTHRIIAPLAVHVCVNSLAAVELWRAFLVDGH
ncbi:MAG: lysostaphin resistance A-like protein [Pirellulales bacterium]